jgi:hypothetical protein
VGYLLPASPPRLMTLIAAARAAAFAAHVVSARTRRLVEILDFPLAATAAVGA